MPRVARPTILARMKPIIDRAEVSIDYPDKAFMGAFGRRAGFDVSADADGVAIKLASREGEKREVQIHLHYYLLTDILDAMAAAMKGRLAGDPHLPSLCEAATSLRDALAATKRG
jgi:hypothetical protein